MRSSVITEEFYTESCRLSIRRSSQKKPSPNALRRNSRSVSVGACHVTWPPAIPTPPECISRKRNKERGTNAGMTPQITNIAIMPTSVLLKYFIGFLHRAGNRGVLPAKHFVFLSACFPASRFINHCTVDVKRGRSCRHGNRADRDGFVLHPRKSVSGDPMRSRRNC
jgi:hypothetical protein